MRICSHCRRSYPEHAQKCPACDLYLLGVWRPGDPIGPMPAAKSHGSSQGLVVVARCRTRWEADFVRTLLESEGIATGQKPSAATETWSYLPSPAAAIEVLVRAEDEDEARDILLSGRDEATGETLDS